MTGHKEDAKLVLHKIAKGNCTILPEGIELVIPENTPQDRKGFLALFSFPEIARRSIIQFMCWYGCIHTLIPV